jgi:nucleoside-diphosphate-sugar epimerase
MKILITGITGLIGHHLMEVLLKNQYYDIRGQFFSKRDLTLYTTQGIEMIQADICNKEDLQDITQNCNVVVHSAAKVIDFGSKIEFYNAHYNATSYLLEDSLKNNVAHFIYISSIGVASGIDRKKTTPDESTSLVKTGIHYDDVKIDTEALVKDFCIQHNITYTIIRPSAVIGKGSVWVNEPLKRLDTTVGLKLIDKGRHPACLIDAENLANGIYLCITNANAKNQTYFFMDDWDISWKQYFNDLAAIKGRKINASLPYGIAYLLAVTAEFIFPIFGKNPPLAKKSVKATGTNRTVSTEKARKELGWHSAVSYEASMKNIRKSITG